MEQGIHDLLLADATVAGLIGTRLSPLVLPESPVLPAATYQLISAPSTYTNDGPLGLDRSRLQIDCWGETYASVKQTAKAMRTVLDGYVGTLTDGTVVYETERDDASDGLEPGSRLYRAQSDWLILHSS